MSKRILIDGRFVGVGDSISRYVLEMTKGILEIDKENEYTLLIRPVGIKSFQEFFCIREAEIKELINPPAMPDAKHLRAGKSKLEIRNLCVSVLDIPHYSIAEQVELPKYLNREKFDLVHFTQFNHPILYKDKFVVTIHDLTLYGHLHYFSLVKRLAFGLVMRSAVKNSKKIITVSNTAKDDGIDFFNVSNDKFQVIYHGIDHGRFNNRIENLESKIKQFKEKYSIKGDYILYTGMWKKHKNLLRLFQAYERFKQNTESPISLVLTGRIDKNEPEVLSEMERINQELNTNGRMPNTILTTGFIDEAELPIAYAGALAYVMPSLSEGFGWPPLEAMACGTPVISSKESCMPEILGDAPLYFDPYSVEDIASAITKITADAALRKDLSEKGLEQAKKYDWKDCARKTLEVYKNILSSK